MVMSGYIAHHQVYTIFQGSPRQVPADHMCHPWPISRVGSRAQNFALKSQIGLLDKSLRTLWTFFSVADDYGAWDLLEKKGGNLRSCGPESIAKKNADFSFLFFSGTPLHKLCTWLLLKKNLGGTYSIQTYGSAELIFWFCVVDFCWFNVFP